MLHGLHNYVTLLCVQVDSSVVSTTVSQWGGPGFKLGQGPSVFFFQELWFLLPLKKKETCSIKVVCLDPEHSCKSVFCPVQRQNINFFTTISFLKPLQLLEDLRLKKPQKQQQQK